MLLFAPLVTTGAQLNSPSIRSSAELGRREWPPPNANKTPGIWSELTISRFPLVSDFCRESNLVCCTLHRPWGQDGPPTQHSPRDSLPPSHIPSQALLVSMSTSPAAQLALLPLTDSASLFTYFRAIISAPLGWGATVLLKHAMSPPAHILRNG